MIKEALEYIVGLKDQELVEIDGNKYLKNDYRRVHKDRKECDITVASLSAFVSYIDNECDSSNMEKLIATVAGNELVCLSGETGPEGKWVRNEYIVAKAELPRISLNMFIPMESFIIQLNTCFDREQGDWEKLLALASSIQLKEEVKTSDDGISQNVTAKTGVARVSEVRLPNPVQLAPIRTFQELQQPLSPFVFRIDQNGQLGLFEADGGAWKYTARERIKGYLDASLGDLTILA